MKLQRIEYNDLNSRQMEAYNFQKAAAVLADYGFTCSWKQCEDGTDFIAKHIEGNAFKVQLTPRLIVRKRWQGHGLYVVFPVQGENQAGRTWYLVCHDSLVELADEKTTWLKSKDWQDKGYYSCPSPPKSILRKLCSYVL